MLRHAKTRVSFLQPTLIAHLNSMLSGGTRQEADLEVCEEQTCPSSWLRESSFLYPFSLPFLPPLALPVLSLFSSFSFISLFLHYSISPFYLYLVILNAINEIHRVFDVKKGLTDTAVSYPTRASGDRGSTNQTFASHILIPTYCQ